MKLFTFLLRANVAKVVTAMVVSVVGGVASMGVVALLTRVSSQGLYTSSTWLAAFVAVLLVAILTGYAAQIMVLDLALRAIAELRLGLSDKVLATPLQRLERLGLPRILAALTDDVSAVSRILPNVPRMVFDGTTLLAGIAYLAWLSPKALLVLLAFIAVGFSVYRVLTRRSVRLIALGREVYDALFEHFRALHEGIKQLKLNQRRRRSFLFEDLEGDLESYRSLNMRGRTLLVWAETLTRFLFFVLLGALIFFVPRMEGIDQGVVAGYFITGLYLFRPLSSIMGLVPEFSRAAVSLKKVEELGLTLEGYQLDRDAEPARAPAGWKRIEVRGARYVYASEGGDRAFSLGPIDLSFEPGELVFVLGGNGSGKTTLAKVLTSLYPLAEGEIRLDGESVTAENVERYRQLFSVVFTDFHLFRTLQGREGATSAEVDRVANEHLRRLRLDHKVAVEEGRLSTLSLSQGQRKRLALLTAYLEDRPFYVLDEWAADQDPEFKKTFYTEVLPTLRDRGKTLLVITHDDRFTYVADRCLKLEDGALVPFEEPAHAAGGEPGPSGRPEEQEAGRGR